MALGAAPRVEPRNTRSAALRPISAAVAGAIKTCARTIAGASFNPSPTIRTRWPEGVGSSMRPRVPSGSTPGRFSSIPSAAQTVGKPGRSDRRRALLSTIQLDGAVSRLLPHRDRYPSTRENQPAARPFFELRQLYFQKDVADAPGFLPRSSLSRRSDPPGQHHPRSRTSVTSRPNRCQRRVLTLHARPDADCSAQGLQLQRGRPQKPPCCVTRISPTVRVPVLSKTTLSAWASRSEQALPPFSVMPRSIAAERPPRAP